MEVTKTIGRRRVSFGEWKKKKKLEYKVANGLMDQRSYNKRSRKFAKYAKQGQLIGGEFYCKSGKIIDQERLDKYEGLCHHMVQKFLPARALFEAALDYEDLVNQCRLEVFLALLDGFDPVKAMSVTEKDPVKRERALAKKQADPDAALSKAEKAIVYGRLQNYLRRTRWEYHPEQLGGQTESLDAAFADGHHREIDKNYFSFDVCDQTLETKDNLLDVLETYGPERVRDHYNSLDEDARGSLVEHLEEVASWK